MRRRLVAITLLLALVLTTLGCNRPVSSRSGTPQPALPDVASDYPGWTVENQVGPTVISLIAGSDVPGTRGDVAFDLTSSDGSMRILAWYASSSNEDTATGWFNPDELYCSSSWDSAKARALFEWMRTNAPNEQLLGAYPDRSTSEAQALELWHVGFFSQGAASWVRGDHLLSYDVGSGTWAMVKDDSGSDNSWNTIGFVRRTR